MSGAAVWSVFAQGFVGLSLTALAMAPRAVSAQEPAQVRIKGEISGSQLRMYFDPAMLTVSPGTTVTWVNEDGSNHTVKFGDASSGRMGHHKTWSRTFSAPGTYPYECAIHGASMSGTVIVQ